MQIPREALKILGCLSEASFREFSFPKRICSFRSGSLDFLVLLGQAKRTLEMMANATSRIWSI